MSNLIKSNDPLTSAGNLIETGQKNPKGTVGAIALAVAAVGMTAIKVISDLSKKQ